MNDPARTPLLLSRSGAVVCGLGTGLAGYSVLVKLAAIPCFSAACGYVINSEYGVVFGIPVGLFGLLLWGALPLLPRNGQIGVKVVLVAGSIVFLLIQALVLKRYCSICLAHAAVCLLVAPLPVAARSGSVAAFLGLFLSLAVAVGADGWNRHRLREQIGARTATSQVDRNEVLPGLAWLGAEPIGNVRLVLSLTCGQCQRILEQALGEGDGIRRAAPILFSSAEENAAVTRVAVAAVLSVGEDDRPDAFARVLGILLSDPAILGRDDIETATFLLGADFPDLETHLGQAAAVLVDHDDALRRLGILTTPAMVINGSPAPFDRSAAFGK